MCHTFEKMMISWIGVQQDVEQEEALQLAWLDFSRSAPKRPELVNTDNLAPLMEFLKRSAKTAVLQLRRAQKRQAWAVSLDLLTAATDQGSDDGSSQSRRDQQRLHEVLEDSQRWTDAVEVRLILQQRLNELVQDRLEQKIFDLFYCLHIPQKEIVTILSSPAIPDDKAVAQVIQRIKRRMRQDETLRSLLPTRQNSADPAFLAMTMMSESNQAVKDQFVETRCAYDEATLLEYMMGIGPAEVSAAIAVSPACQRAVHTLIRELGTLLQILYRQQCPTTEKLIAYQSKELQGTEQMVLHQHVTHCPLCQEEMQILTAIDNVTLVAEENWLRRAIEAIFQSPLGLPQPVRGEWLHYRTPELLIMISVRRGSTQARTWTLRAQLRNEAGQLISDRIEHALLQRLDTPTEELHTLTIAPEDTSLVFKNLTAGDYTLQVFIPNTEILIRKITIGDA